MENNYDKNMEALLKKAFLAQDLKAAKNEGLLAASSQATFRGTFTGGFFSTLSLVKGLIVLTVVGAGLSSLLLINNAEAHYVPNQNNFKFKDITEETNPLIAAVPLQNEIRLKTDISEPSVKTTKQLVWKEKQKAIAPVKVFTPEKTFVLPKELKENDLKEHNKEKHRLVREVLKLSKKKIAQVEVFSQYVRKGEKALQNYAIWKTEISNYEYNLFLRDLLVQNRIEEYKAAKYDSTTWTRYQFKSYFEPMENMYHWHPAYNDYPVVNIPREGARLFCKWLTQEIIKTGDKTEVASIEIPTNREWEYAASSGGKMKPYPWGGTYLRNSKGCYLANFRPGTAVKSTCFGGNDKTKDDVSVTEKNKTNPFIADGGLITVKVDSYNPNEFGIYNMAGNVAEMVSYPYENQEIGAKGGDWFNKGEFLKISAPDSLKGISEPRSTIGFRPVIHYKAGSDISSTNKDIISNPSLTEEEKKKNTKRKEELIKQIIKIDHDYYTDVLYGGMELNGKKVQIKNIIANRFEVSVINYKTFLFDLIVQERFQEFHQYKPKYETWGVDTAMYNFFFHDYYITPGVHDRAAINIPIEGAKGYCNWLFAETKKADFRNKMLPLKAIRIPTYEEWMFLATNRGRYDNRKTINYYQEQIKTDSLVKFWHNFKSGSDGAVIATSVVSEEPASLGLHHIFGNAAEIVQYADGEYGSKGGSWNSKAEELWIYAEDKTKGNLTANAETGFRFILEWDRDGENSYLPSVKIKPQLTEEQKKATKKQKAKMLSNLLKTSNDEFTTILISDPKDSVANFQMGKHEVSNLEYRTFLFDLIVQGRYEEFHSAKPDRTKWRTEKNKNEPYAKYYFIHEAYNNYPVVNITTQGAQQFCDWLFAEAEKIDSKKRLNQINSVRLPFYQEWMIVASDFGTFTKYPWKQLDTKVNSEGKAFKGYLANYKINKDDVKESWSHGSLNDNAEITAPINSYFPNVHGVYNIVGNVAEMVKYKDGTYGSKGGSWNSSAEEIEIYAPDKTKGNLKASPTAGFRVVIEWVPFKTDDGQLIGVQGK